MPDRVRDRVGAARSQVIAARVEARSSKTDAEVSQQCAREPLSVVDQDGIPDQGRSKAMVGLDTVTVRE